MTQGARRLDGTGLTVRASETVTVEPLGESCSRGTVEFDLTGHGLGRLFAPFGRAQAHKQVPDDQRKLKQLLESRA